MKMKRPPDINKVSYIHANNTCWLATASNMLAAANYENGATTQTRADTIYGQMINNYGYTDGGHPIAALEWWLGSAHNTWPDNLYIDPIVRGNIDGPPCPWVESNVQSPQVIGNDLRECSFVGLGLGWGGTFGHAITAWGDNWWKGPLWFNPTRVIVTDSDDIFGQARPVQEYNYTYSNYSNPECAVTDVSDVWHIDYLGNPYLINATVLTKTDASSGGQVAHRTMCSYSVRQLDKLPATALQYTVENTQDILKFSTDIDWSGVPPPTITGKPPVRSIKVLWDFSKKPVPYKQDVIITLESTVPRKSIIRFRDVRFSYSGQIKDLPLPDVGWKVERASIENASKIPNVTGGYLIGAFKLAEPLPSGPLPVTTYRVVGEYRFVHKYHYDQDPENYRLLLWGTEGFFAADLRLGHSYGYPDEELLWNFDQWRTHKKGYPLSNQPVKIEISWKDQLPYPKGVDIKTIVKHIGKTHDIDPKLYPVYWLIENPTP